MPTRALGDFRLKKAEFNNHSYSRDLGYRNAIPAYNGPYITHVPDIQVHDLTKEDTWLVLATDGLWDEINRKKAAIIANKHGNNYKELTEK